MTEQLNKNSTEGKEQGPSTPPTPSATDTDGKEAARQHRRHHRWGFRLWVEKISWRRIWQPTSVFLPGESHGQRSLVGCGAWVTELDTTELYYSYNRRSEASRHRDSILIT